MRKGKYTINLNIRLTVCSDKQANEIIKRIIQLSNVNDLDNVDERILLHSFLRTELEYDQIQDSTRKNRNTTIQWVEKIFPELHVHELKPEHINIFVKRLKKEKLSTNTIIKHLHHLRLYVHRAVKQKLLESNWLAQDIFQLKAEPHHHTFLSSDEVACLASLNLQKAKPTVTEVHRAFLFACYTGLRFSDLFQLHAHHIVEKEGNTWVVLQMKKTQSYIQIPLDLLFQGKGLQVIVPLLKRRKGKLFHLKNNTESNRILKRICQKAGIKKNVSFHVARHTFGTQLLSHGLSLEVVQKLLGHRNVRTTQIYAELTQQALVRELTRVSW